MIQYDAYGIAVKHYADRMGVLWGEAQLANLRHDRDMLALAQLGLARCRRALDAEREQARLDELARGGHL